MGSAWLGLLGAITGGLVSLAGTLITTRLQWRQERTRWKEQRERDLLQWNQQRESDLEKWENERRHSALEWERNRDDARFQWNREQKLRCYLEALDHLITASELSSNASPVSSGEQRRYAREDEMAIVQQLRKGYRWTKSASAVCGTSVIERLNELSSELYFTIQTITHEGIKSGEMVRRPRSSNFEEWILSETIDTMSARLTDIMRADLGTS
jgi:hypothetical protein